LGLFLIKGYRSLKKIKSCGLGWNQKGKEKVKFDDITIRDFVSDFNYLMLEVLLTDFFLINIERELSFRLSWFVFCNMYKIWTASTFFGKFRIKSNNWYKSNYFMFVWCIEKNVN